MQSPQWNGFAFRFPMNCPLGARLPRGLLILAALVVIGWLPTAALWPPQGAGARAGEPPQSAASEREASRPLQPVQVLVVYYSRTGNTEKLAEAVVRGAKRVRGVRVTLKRVDEVTKDDLQRADGLVLGCPTYFANIPGVMKTLIDQWNWRWKVDFTDKVGGAFSTGGGQMGGKEHVVVSLLLFMINNRMIVAGPLYEDEQGEDIWGELGASAMTGPIDPGVDRRELEGALRLGQRIASLAVKIHGQRPAADNPTGR